MASWGASEDLWVQHWPEKSLHIRSTTSFTTSSLNYKKSYVSRDKILIDLIQKTLLIVHQLEEAESGVFLFTQILMFQWSHYLLHVWSEPHRRGLIFWFVSLTVLYWNLFKKIHQKYAKYNYLFELILTLITRHKHSAAVVSTLNALAMKVLSEVIKKHLRWQNYQNYITRANKQWLTLVLDMSKTY